MTAVDYAFPPQPTPAALLAAGATGVLRYLSWLTIAAAPKVITAAEFAALRAAGLPVTLNWEYGADDFTSTTFDAAGAAREAVRQAGALGYPDDCAIYYSVDQDVTAAQWPTVAGHLRAINGVHGVARTGVYGPWDVLELARRDGVASWFWQAGMSTAWSGGRNAALWPGAHLRQVRRQTIDGADCDINDIIQADYGQYGGTMSQPYAADNADAHGYAVTQRLKKYGVHASGTDPGLTTIDNQLEPLLAKLEAFLDRPPAPLAELSEADRVAIVAGLTEALTPLIPTAAQVATAVLDEQHRRDAA